MARPNDPPGAWRSLDGGTRLAQACCLTLVRGLSVQQTLTRLRAATTDTITTTLDDLVSAAYGAGRGAGWQLAGVAALEGWALVCEPNGFACTDPARMRPASAGTTAVTLYRSGEDPAELVVLEDGRRVFGLDLPGCRAGTVLVEHLTGVRLSVGLLEQLSYRTGWLRL